MFIVRDILSFSVSYVVPPRVTSYGMISCNFKCVPIEVCFHGDVVGNEICLYLLLVFIVLLS